MVAVILAKRSKNGMHGLNMPMRNENRGDQHQGKIRQEGRKEEGRREETSSEV